MGQSKIVEIKETWQNVTEKYISGDSSFYVPFTEHRGELFRALQKENGRCISKMYKDYNDQAIVIGWVFEKRAKYTDTGEVYLRHTWVELREVISYAA